MKAHCGGIHKTKNELLNKHFLPLKQNWWGDVMDSTCLSVHLSVLMSIYQSLDSIVSSAQYKFAFKTHFQISRTYCSWQWVKAHLFNYLNFQNGHLAAIFLFLSFLCLRVEAYWCWAILDSKLLLSNHMHFFGFHILTLVCLECQLQTSVAHYLCLCLKLILIDVRFHSAAYQISFVHYSNFGMHIPCPAWKPTGFHGWKSDFVHLFVILLYLNCEI